MEPARIVTYSTCANHLAVAVLELPKNCCSRNISAVIFSNQISVCDASRSIKAGKFSNRVDIKYHLKQYLLKEGGDWELVTVVATKAWEAM